MAARVQYNSFPKILSAPDIYTTDAFVTAAVAGVHSKTQVALYPSPSPPSPRVRTGLEAGRLIILQFSHIYIQGESRRFLHNDENTASSVYTI